MTQAVQVAKTGRKLSMQWSAGYRVWTQMTHRNAVKVKLKFDQILSTLFITQKCMELAIMPKSVSYKQCKHKDKQNLLYLPTADT